MNDNLKQLYARAVPLVRSWLEEAQNRASSAWGLLRRLAREYDLLLRLVAVFLAALVIWLITTAGWDYWKGPGEGRGSLIRDLAIVLGGAYGLWLARVRTRASDRQAVVAESGHLTDRFAKGVEQLGHGETAVRMGAIYALGQLAQDHRYRFHVPVTETLAAFVRTRSNRLANKGTTGGNEDGNLPRRVDPEIQAAINVIADISVPIEQLLFIKGGFRINLEESYLARVRLAANANFGSASFARSDLTSAEFTNFEVDLSYADFDDATLRWAKLGGAKIAGARFNNADLRGASLRGVWLAGNADGANSVVPSNLRDIELLRANISGADFTNSKNLTQDQIDQAYADPSDPPKLPPGLKPPPPKVRS